DVPRTPLCAVGAVGGTVVDGPHPQRADGLPRILLAAHVRLWRIPAGRPAWLVGSRTETGRQDRRGTRDAVPLFPGQQFRRLALWNEPRECALRQDFLWVGGMLHRRIAVPARHRDRRLGIHGTVR